MDQAPRPEARSTATWDPNTPSSAFSYATYRDRKGRAVQLPVEVYGDHITVQFVGLKMKNERGE